MRKLIRGEISSGSKKRQQSMWHDIAMLIYYLRHRMLIVTENGIAFMEKQEKSLSTIS